MFIMGLKFKELIKLFFLMTFSPRFSLKSLQFKLFNSKFLTTENEKKTVQDRMLELRKVNGKEQQQKKTGKIQANCVRHS